MPLEEEQTAAQGERQRQRQNRFVGVSWAESASVLAAAPSALVMRFSHLLVRAAIDVIGIGQTAGQVELGQRLHTEGGENRDRAAEAAAGSSSAIDSTR